MLVSAWAAAHRKLPPELTSKPGAYDPWYTPYLVEIMDRLSVSDSTRKLVVMKAGQVGATTGIGENWIGYTISEAPCGMLFITADKDLAKMGIQLKVDRMLESAGLRHLVRAPDGKSKRSGDTSTFKEFTNGFLAAFGARNPAKLRFISAKNAFVDELDAMPTLLGSTGKEEGGPLGLIDKRTDIYPDRKIAYVSTPLNMQTSLINPLWLAGDQRRFFVPCVHCGEFQYLEWHGVTEGGAKYGMTFECEERTGKLIGETVGYVCRYCAAIFYNHDKTTFLPQGEWRPQSETNEEGLTSYHIPAFLSPPGMYAWQRIAEKWLRAWDVVNDRVRDIDEYRQFRNLEEGVPWEERGESPSFERVRYHRRQHYVGGQIPNDQANEETGSPVILLTAAADVHKDRVDCEVVGWTAQRQTYSIEWLHFEGDPEDHEESGPWAGMAELLLERQWIADDGRVYGIWSTLIDAGYKLDAVNQFCQGFTRAVFPVMGRELPQKGAVVKEFNQSKTASGNVLVNCTASLYKDRLAAWLRMDWNEGKRQPVGYPNYPADRGDDFFKQYEAEEKVLELHRVTKAPGRYRWRQIGQRPNHAWDCRVYNMCAFDMIVHEACVNELFLEKIDYFAWATWATPRRNADLQWLPTPYSFHPEEVDAT